jgi:putative flippase GtrA
VTKLTPWGVRDRVLRTPTGKKLVRYTMVSAISVVISQALLAFTYGVLEWSAIRSNIFAVAVSSVPAYYLNRAWAWGKRGRSHLMREVVPFWALNFLGLVVSTIFADIAEDRAQDFSDSRFTQTLIINGAALAAFGLLWVGKFVILNKLLFRSHPEDLEDVPALDGRTGVPT